MPWNGGPCSSKERAYPRGFDVEVASFSALTEAVELATKKYEREHVMPYLYTHPEKFTVKYIDPPPEVSRPRYRLCVDTRLDLQVIQKIHDHFGSALISAEYNDIIGFLDDNPEVPLINQTIKQRHFTESDSREK